MRRLQHVVVENPQVVPHKLNVAENRVRDGLLVDFQDVSVLVIARGRSLICKATWRCGGRWGSTHKVVSWHTDDGKRIGGGRAASLLREAFE